MFVLVRREFAFKALFAKRRGSIYSLFLSEDPPANEGSRSKESTEKKIRSRYFIAEKVLVAAVSRTYLLRKTTFFSLVFTVFSFLRISNFFVSITCEQREY